MQLEPDRRAELPLVVRASPDEREEGCARVVVLAELVDRGRPSRLVDLVGGVVGERLDAPALVAGALRVAQDTGGSKVRCAGEGTDAESG
jgi:hypothetical protein